MSDGDFALTITADADPTEGVARMVDLIFLLHASDPANVNAIRGAVPADTTPADALG